MTVLHCPAWIEADKQRKYVPTTLFFFLILPSRIKGIWAQFWNSYKGADKKVRSPSLYSNPCTLSCHLVQIALQLLNKWLTSINFFSWHSVLTECMSCALLPGVKYGQRAFLLRWEKVALKSALNMISLKFSFKFVRFIFNPLPFPMLHLLTAILIRFS